MLKKLFLTTIMLLSTSYCNGIEYRSYHSNPSEYNRHSDNIRSTPNIYGGKAYYYSGRRIISVPNDFGGHNYSNGYQSRANIFGGKNFSRRYSSR